MVQEETYSEEQENFTNRNYVETPEEFVNSEYTECPESSTNVILTEEGEDYVNSDAEEVSPPQSKSPARKVDNFDGDVTVQNDVSIGGVLRAKRIVHPWGGWFHTYEELAEEIPHPLPGMWAITGSVYPLEYYWCRESGVWEKFKLGDISEKITDILLKGEYATQQWVRDQINRIKIPYPLSLQEVELYLEKNHYLKEGDVNLNIDLSGLENKLSSKLDSSEFKEFKTLFDSMFEKVTQNGKTSIKAKYGLWTNEFLSSRVGESGGSGSGGGTSYNRLDAWDKYTADKAGYVLSAFLGKDLDTRLSAIEGDYAKKSDIPSLSRYATQQWVEARGYLTQLSLHSLTIKKNGVTVDTYNPSADKTIDITDVASAATLLSHTGDMTAHITATERTKWNKTATDFAAIVGVDSDSIINKWEEVIAFLATYTEADTLAGLLSNKVDKVSGKGLSTNDFTDTLLAKLNGIESGANKYVHPTHTSTNIAAANGSVLSAITVDALGHVSSVSSKTLVEADIPSLSVSKIRDLQTKLDLKLDKSVFDDLFEKVNIGTASAPVYAIRAKYGLFSNSFISSRGGESGGSGSGSGGGTSYNRLDAWDKYTADKAGYVLSAFLGNDLNSRLSAVEGDYAKKSDIPSLARYVTTNTAQEISATKTFTAGLRVSGRVFGGNDDEGIVIGKADNGFAALTLGVHNGARSVFYLGPTNDAFWRWSDGTNGFDIHHPKKSGTIALTSDITSSLGNYYTKTEADGHFMRYFWTLEPGYDCSTHNDKSLVSFTYSNNAPFNGGFIDVNTNGYGFYLGTGYSSDGPLFFRRHGTQNDGGMGSWRTLLDNVNYASTLDSRYVNADGDMMSGYLTIDTVGISDSPLRLNANGAGCYIQMASNNAVHGSYGATAGGPVWNWNNSNFLFWHQGNDGSGSGLDADLLDGYHATCGSYTPYGTIPVIHPSGFMDVGRHFEFHYDNTTGSDYSTILACTGNYSNIVNLPSASGTLALLSDNVASATNADMLDGLHSTSFGRAFRNSAIDANDFNSLNGLWGGKLYNATNAPYSYYAFLHFGLGQYYGQFNAFNNQLQFRAGSESNGEPAWKTIAFTDSNVASATKLQTTRLIWGRYFDGTENITGNMESVDNIYMSGYVLNNVNGQYLSVLDYHGNGSLALNHGLATVKGLPCTIYGNTVVKGDLSLDGSLNASYLNEVVRIKGTSSNATYLRQSGIPTSAGNLGTAIGLGVASEYYGLFMWGESTGKGHIQVGRKDGSDVPYNLILQEFGGNVGIGTTNPTEKLTVNGWVGTIGNTGWYSITHGGGWWMKDSTYIRNYNSRRLLIEGINDYYAVWLSSGGFCTEGYAGTSWNQGYGALNVGIANNDNQTPLLVAYRNGSALEHTDSDRLFSMEFHNSGWLLRLCFGGADKFEFISNGVFHALGGIYAERYVSSRGSNSSDERLKTDIRDFRASDIIRTLHPRAFRWNDFARSMFPVFDTDDTQYGLIAQEAKVCHPWLVDENMFGDGYMGVFYDKLIPVLLQGENELFSVTDDHERRITDQETRIAELEAENRKLRKRIEILTA